MSSTKHIMLSYQWDNQKLVSEVYRRLKEQKISLWMDIHGGMKGHLSDSMATGVENAEAICCFMTPKYQDSVACKDELTYAKERGVCIIPIRLMVGWKPTGWLGFTITGHKWIDFRDVDTNMDVRIEQLIKEIQMLVGNRLDYSPGMEFNNLCKDFEPDSYYRFTTQSLGANKALDIFNDGENNNRPILDTIGNYSGQYWRITPISDGFYRLTTQWQGDRKSLSVVIDGKGNNQLILADTSDCPKQYWKITQG